MERGPALLVLGLVLALAIVPAVVHPAAAGPIDFSSDEGAQNFGRLDQNDVGAMFGDCGCGPVAAVNSFVYLENAFGSIYGTSLTPLTTAGENATAQNLALNYMHTKPTSEGSAGATSIHNFITGKMDYIEKMVPERTDYEAQVSPKIVGAGFTAPDTTLIKPTGRFLAHQLQDGEDVEILFSRFDSSGKEIFGHFATAVALNWVNQAGDKVMHQSDGATFDFVNPNGGTLITGRRIYEDASGLHEIGPTGTVFDITAVVAESPHHRILAEPSGLALLPFASAVLLGVRCAAARTLRRDRGKPS